MAFLNYLEELGRELEKRKQHRPARRVIRQRKQPIVVEGLQPSSAGAVEKTSTYPRLVWSNPRPPARPHRL